MLLCNCNVNEMSWSKSQVKLLIDQYKAHPCLYAVKHIDYKNKRARNKALSAICTELANNQPGGVPGICISEIKNKFNNIRTNFLAQYRKYLTCFQSNTNADEISKPNLWYFDNMMFIVDHIIPKETVDIISTKSPNEQEYMEQEYNEPEKIDSEENSQSLDNLVSTQVENSPQSLRIAQTPTKILFINASQLAIKEEPASEYNYETNIKANPIPCFTLTQGASNPIPCFTTTQSGSIPMPRLIPTQGGSIPMPALVPTQGGSKQSLLTYDAKKRKTSDEDDIIEPTAKPLKQIQKAGNFKKIQSVNNQTQSEIFGNFVAKQISFIEQCDEEYFLDVQHEISEILYTARKKCLQKDDTL